MIKIPKKKRRKSRKKTTRVSKTRAASIKDRYRKAHKCALCGKTSKQILRKRGGVHCHKACYNKYRKVI